MIDPYKFREQNTVDGHWTSIKDYLTYFEMCKRVQAEAPVFEFFKIDGKRYMTVSGPEGELDLGEPLDR